MTRREMLDRMALVGAGMVMSPFHRTARADPDPRQRLLAQAEALSEQKQKVKSLESMGCIVVTWNGPDDGGQFGKNTPGTRTSGLQEAFNHAAETGQDVYICGGGRPRYQWYILDETLRIPWMQNWHCDGGEYFIGYTPSTGDAVVIDSMMSSTIKLGGVASRADGAVVRLKPETKGPDGFATWEANLLEFNALVGPVDVMGEPGSVQKGIGLWLDASSGLIYGNQIFLIEINACDKGIYMNGMGTAHGRSGFGSNWIRTPFVHNCNTSIQIGDSETPHVGSNWIEASMTGQKPAGVGVQIFGQQNTLLVSIAETAPGKDIVFEAEARDNLIIAQNLSSGITNNAVHPTNRIITTTPVGFDIPTPPVPASCEDAVNRNPYLVQITILTPGQVSDWTETDANGTSETVSAGLLAGQRFLLDPGDRIRFTYTIAPSWRWKALR